METSWNIYQDCHSLPFSNWKNVLPSKTNIHIPSLIPYHSSHLTSSVYALSFIMIFVFNLKFASSNNIKESGNLAKGLLILWYQLLSYWNFWL